MGASIVATALASALDLIREFYAVIAVFVGVAVFALIVTIIRRGV